MPKKKDPTITFLNQFGYNVVKLPRVGIEPMDVIGRDQTTQWLGPIRSVWKSTVAEPTPSAPRPATSIIGKKTDALDLKLGLKVLANALAAFGATVPSLDFAYTRASSVQFSYTNVTSTAVAPLEAGNYLTSGTLNTESPVVRHYFTGEDTQAFLIVDVLKSDSIIVTALDSRGTSVDVSVPAIEGVLGVNVGVKASASGDSSLTYTGKQAVTFGFSVDELQFDGTRWSMSGTPPSGEIAFGLHAGATPDAGKPTPVLLSSGCMVNLI